MDAPEVLNSVRPAHLALFDATTLTAKGIRDQLVARSFPIASMRLFTSGNDPDANLTEFAGAAMLVTRPDVDMLDDLEIAFLCGTRKEGEQYLDWARRAGFVAIDLTRASSGDATPVNALVNPEAVGRRPGVIATPHPVAQMLSSLFGLIRRQCGLEEAMAVVLQPASERGEPGLDELYRQALSVMNFSELPKEVFGRQLAFNLIPGHLAEEAKSASATRADIEREVLRITGGGYRLAVQTIQAPVFHGHAAVAHLVLPAGRGREDLLAALKRSDDIAVGSRGGKITPVERAGEGGLIVADVRQGLGESSFWVWAVVDDMVAGTSLNAVRIAELLLSHGPDRGGA